MHDRLSTLGVWTPRRISFLLIATLLFLTQSLHLSTPVLAVLFSTFVLRKLHFVERKWLSIVLFACVVCLIFYAFGTFVRRAARTLPSVAEESIPKVVEFADERGVKLPFEDVGSLKTLATREMSERFSELTNFAKLATKEVVVLLIGLVVAVSAFLNPKLDIDPHQHPIANNLYSACCNELVERMKSFYQSFETVMGAQIIISMINTALTAVFIFSVSMKHPVVLVGVTFLCGLLPIIGNILSNCVIVAVGFTMSPTMAIAALVFLVLLHKLEYFLNSKIIGDRIKNPVWLTMMGLIVGERLMGISGMILAPVVLYYMKVEAGKIPLPEPAKEQPTQSSPEISA